MGSHNYQDTPMPRRHSLLDVSLAPKWRHRSHSLGLVNVSGFSPGLSQMSTSGSQRTPATPCFVSPRMAFSTQFSYDSPIQILTSSSPGALTPAAVSKLKGRCSMKRLSRRWKIVLIMFFTALGTGLFISRKMSEISSMHKSSCEDGEHGEHGCETDHRHPGLAERFMDVVSIDKVHEHFHTLARGLRRNLEGKEQQQQGEPAGEEQEAEKEDQTLEETLFDTETTAEDLEEQEQEKEQKELEDERALGVPDRHPRGLGEQTTYGTRNSEGGRKVVESEYQEDGEDAPPAGQRASHLAPQQRQPEVTYRRTGSPPKKIVAAQTRAQGKPSSAWSQQLNQQQQKRNHQQNYQQNQQQNLGQRRSESHRGQRPPQDGRRFAQGKRPLRTPPGVNPRRYEM
ncbi:putative uncharacterized protein DDB_G0271606 [Penaeus indicus]|uniref:putative uncharacterized protein DDB_G0271606 n=1 Tax=Penaeus indicus TaxID=29960 RepID=UPI00300D6C5B